MNRFDAMLKMTDLDLANKRVIIREDFNVPMEKGMITNDARIRRALPTLKKAVAEKARVVVLSHLGRPEEGVFEKDFSLEPVAKALSKALNQEVKLVSDWMDYPVQPGEIILGENVRFLMGENKNDAQLAKRMAQRADIFVMDAFATAHRAQASTAGIADYVPVACAGPLMVEELEALSKALANPARPLIAIVGGSKVSTKFQLLESLLQKVNVLIVGGGIANTFLKAAGYPVGKSLYESDWVAQAKKLLDQAKMSNVQIPLPQDVRTAKEFSPQATAEIKSVQDVKDDDLILDIGPKTENDYQKFILQAQTIVWNGPVGVFEFPAFSHGTRAIGKAVDESHSFSIAGGGDTIAAIEQLGLQDQISYASTAGGAFLEFLEGRTLPGVAALLKHAKVSN